MSMVFFNRLSTLEKELLKLLVRVEALEERNERRTPVKIEETVPASVHELVEWARKNQPVAKRVKK
jgi:hypothetical protein